MSKKSWKTPGLSAYGPIENVTAEFCGGGGFNKIGTEEDADQGLADGAITCLD